MRLMFSVAVKRSVPTKWLSVLSKKARCMSKPVQEKSARHSNIVDNAERGSALSGAHLLIGLLPELLL